MLVNFDWVDQFEQLKETRYRYTQIIDIPKLYDWFDQSIVQ